jgi:hypothetical protein
MMVALSGEENNGGPATIPGNLPEKLQTVHFSQAIIEETNIEGARQKGLHRCITVAQPIKLVALRGNHGKDIPDQVQIVLIIFDEKDSCWHSLYFHEKLPCKINGKNRI